MIRFFNGFVKVTGWLVQKIIFRTKIYYEDKSVQSRRIKGKAIISSNHTACRIFSTAATIRRNRTLSESKHSWRITRHSAWSI